MKLTRSLPFMRLDLLASLALLLLPLAGSRAATPGLVPEKKLVLAHYMTKMVPGVSGEGIWTSPELHDPNGSTAALGGLIGEPAYSERAEGMAKSYREVRASMQSAAR